MVRGSERQVEALKLLPTSAKRINEINAEFQVEQGKLMKLCKTLVVEWPLTHTHLFH
jgi:predicted transcriptional regulator